ncbi:ATP-binding protein [Planctomycetota bacterium]
MFGGAVLLTLTLVLLILYAWMNQLTVKDVRDICRERAHAVYRAHFKADALVHSSLPALSATGEKQDPNDMPIQWVRFSTDPAQELASVPEPFLAMTQELLADATHEDTVVTEVRDGTLTSQYVKIFRATVRCIDCHSDGNSGQPFSLREPVGAALVTYRDTGGEIRRVRLINRVAAMVAGLLGATGAMIAFYWITQRVILRPIRQLRALVNNVAEGNLDVRSTILTGDEYERLAEAFNHMLDTVEAAQNKLRSANRQLDIKIVELSERNIELYKANKIKSEFLANMSHEFRTPLNAILGFAQVLRDKSSLLKKEKGQRYAENIITSGNRLLHMINDLLQLAKAEAGRLELRIEQGVLAQIAEALVSSFTLQTTEKRIRTKIKINADVPMLATDIGKVQQILYNLFSNAVKFTPRRGRIELSARMLDEKIVRIMVSDTGDGIAMKDQEKIFEKFRQVDGSLTRETHGSGLGLAICKELATMLAGSIGLESEAGQGSVFWLDIPATLTMGEEETDRSNGAV